MLGFNNFFFLSSHFSMDPFTRCAALNFDLRQLQYIYNWSLVRTYAEGQDAAQGGPPEATGGTQLTTMATSASDPQPQDEDQPMAAPVPLDPEATSTKSLGQEYTWKVTCDPPQASWQDLKDYIRRAGQPSRVDIAINGLATITVVYRTGTGPSGN